MKLWILLLAIQGNYASLFEFPRFSANQPQINSSPHITASARLPEVSGVLPKLFGTKEETIQPPNSKFVPKDIKDTSSSGNDNVDEGLDSINISPGFHAAFNLPHISSSPHVTGVKPPNLSGRKKDLKNSNISPGFHAPLNLPHINLSPPETGAKSPELSGVLPQLPNIQKRSSSDDDEYEKDLGDQSISPGFHAALNLPHIRFSPHATGAKLPKLLPQFSSTNGRSSSDNDNTEGKGLKNLNISPGFHAGFNLPDINLSPSVAGAKLPNLPGVLPHLPTTREENSSNKGDDEEEDLNNLGISPGFHASFNLPNINLSPQSTGAKSLKLSEVLPSSPSSGEETIKHPNSKFDNVPNQGQKGSSSDDEVGDEKVLESLGISPEFYLKMTRNQIASLFGLNGKKHENSPIPAIDTSTTVRKSPVKLPKKKDNKKSSDKEARNSNIKKTSNKGDEGSSNQKSKVPNLDVQSIFGNSNIPQTSNNENEGSSDEELRLPNSFENSNIHLPRNIDNEGFSKKIKKIPSLGTSATIGNSRANFPRNHKKRISKRKLRTADSNVLTTTENSKINLLRKHDNEVFSNRNKKSPVQSQPKEEESSGNHLHGKKHKKRFSGQERRVSELGEPTATENFKPNLPTRNDNESLFVKLAKQQIAKTLGLNETELQNLDLSNPYDALRNRKQQPTLTVPTATKLPKINVPKRAENESLFVKLAKQQIAKTLGLNETELQNLNLSNPYDILRYRKQEPISTVPTTTKLPKINVPRKAENESLFVKLAKQQVAKTLGLNETELQNLNLSNPYDILRYRKQEPISTVPTATKLPKINVPRKAENETSLFIKLAKKRLAETLGVNETDLQHLNLSTNFDEDFHHVHKPTSKVPATTEIPKTNIPLTADNESLLIKLAKKHLAEALGVNETDLQHLNLSSNFDEVFHHVHKPPSRAPTTTENPKINIASKTNNESLFVKLAKKRLAETLGVNETDLQHLNLSKNFDEVFHHVHNPTSKVPATTEIPKTNIPLMANNESFFVKLAKKHLAEALGVNETDLQHLNLSTNFDEVLHHVHKPPSRAPATTKIPKINIPSKANNESYFLKRSKELLAKYLGVNEADLQYLNLSSEFPGVFNSPLKNPALSKPGLTEPSKINFPAKNDNTRKENINIDLSNYNHTNHRDVEHEIAKVLSPVLSRSTRNPKEAKDLELKVTLPQNADPSFVRNFITALKSASLQLAPDYHLLSKSIAIQKKNPDELSVHLSNNLQRSSNERNKKSVIPINLKEPYSAISDEIEKIQPTLRKEFEPITIDFNITIPKQVDDDFINQQVDSFLALLEKKIPQDIGSINYIVISITLYPKIGNNTNNFSSSQPFKLLINNVTPQNLKERKPSLISETIPNRTFLNPLKKNLYRTTEAYIENNFSPTQSSTSGEEANSYSWINYFPPEVKLKKKFLHKEKSAASTKQFELNTPTPKLEETLSSSRESSVFHETPKTLHKSELNAANIVRTTNSFSESPTTSTSKIQIKKKLPFSLTPYRKENLPKTRQNYLFSNTGTTSSKFLNWSELNTENIEQTTNSFFSSPSTWKSKIERKRKLPKSRKTSLFSKQEETPKFLKLSQLNRENTEQPTISLFNNPTTWSPKLKKQKKLSKSQTKSLLPKRISKFQNWSELNEESLEQTTNSFFYSPTTSSSKIEKKRKLRKSQENLLFPNTEETFTKFPNWSELTRPNIQQTTNSFFHNRFTGSSETRKQKKVPKSWKNSLPSKTLTKFPNWSELNTKNIEETTNSVFIGPTTSTSKIIRKGNC
ncbi:hypothetical protein HHI36_012861 [Cryptolaemus montrouzieri]|uniref:Uncharacterized protein n=1 Tax=Cryptolaemus montrouzieri TaxID=559131 RepID=A0ABD2NFL3_9CUCU